MENKINIAELLRNCPKGMELDCTMYDGVTLDKVLDGKDYSIKIITKNGFSTMLTKYGQNVSIEEAKCVIYPKGKTTWEGFVPPVDFKDGDIVYTRYSDGDECIFIFENITENTHINSYLHLNGDDLRIMKVWLTNLDDQYFRLATEEEKARLFQAIKDNGYKWNPESKTLEKLVEPKFKVGDRIQSKNFIAERTIKTCEEDGYCTTVDSWIRISDQDNWELVPNKFDISTLVPFESKVLVRAVDNQFWRPAIWGVKHCDWDFCCVLGGEMWEQCIPYEGNEHLLGTTNDCDDFYKNW